MQRLEKCFERVRIEITGVLRAALEGDGKRLEWHVPVLRARSTVEAPDGSVREPPGPHGHIMGSLAVVLLPVWYMTTYTHTPRGFICESPSCVPSLAVP
jgi:hypothetical protein